MTDLVTLENPDGPIAHLRLNRPEKKNAVTLDMLDVLAATVASLSDRPELRAVILSGTGGDFCAGLDTATFLEIAGQIDAIKAQILTPDDDGANRFQRPAKALIDLPVPVIAVIDGVCFGAGMQLALAADFRIAARSARLSIMEGKWGLIPDMGITMTLPQLMPADQAKRLIMSAEIISSERAFAAGLVTELADDPHSAADDLAAALALRSPDAIRAAKALVDRVWRDPSRDGLKLEAALQAEILGAPNQVETVMAQIQNRAPKYL